MTEQRHVEARPDLDDDIREEPARYTRSANGLLAALLVTVLAVGGFVVFRSLFTDTPESYDPGPLDYVEAVSAAQGQNVKLIYPSELPAKWKVTSINFVPGEVPAWGIGMITADGRFVGFRQEAADVDDLVEAYVDKNAEPGDEAVLSSDLRTGAWQTWADSGGDLAYSTTLTDKDDSLHGETVLVYGSAVRADQEKLIELLTLDPLE